MQQYIKKYFWVVGVAVVMLSSMFAARAVNHYVEGEYLGESAEPPKQQRPTVAKPKKPKVARTSKNGDPLAKRNMFCSACEPVEPVETVASGGPGEDGDHVPLTGLPLRLVATNVSTIDEYSFATIRNTSSDRQGAYWIDTDIPEAGKVESIRSRHVDFRNVKTKRLERIALLGKGQAPPKPKAKQPTNAGRKKKNDLMAAIDEGIKKVDDTHYEVDRGLVDKLLANPMSVARGARIVPSIKNGKSNGFKLYAIRPSSIYAKLGLMNGDTIHGVNGFDLTTPDKALEVYTKVKESSNLSVSVTRRGKPVNLDYNIQ